MEEYKIIVYKELMRKYFPKLNIYRLEYYDIDYKDKIINLTKEELDKLNSVLSVKSLDKTEIKEKELLKKLTTLISKIMGMGFIKKPSREASGINGVKKQLNTNIESVNSNLILLLLGGQSLNYDNIEEEVKNINLRDIDVGQQKHQFIDEDDYD
jgi:ribosomal protein L15